MHNHEQKSSELISVIVPMYNSASYIGATIASIRNQTYANLEILCVDDGSTDDTLTYLRELSKQDARIQLFPLVNQGAPGHCRNFGYEKAKGQYIIFFDSDDIMYPTMLEQMYHVMIKNEVDLVIGNPRYIDMDTKQPLSNQMEWFFQKNEHTLTELFQISPFPCNKLYRASFLAKTNIKYLEGVFNQDLGYFLCNLMHEPTYAIISEYVMDYMVRQGSITTNKGTRKKHIDIIAVFDQVFEEWKKTGNNKKFEYGIMHMFIRSMIFKTSFFDLLEETAYIKQIRGNLIKYCPDWHRRKEFKDFFPLKKRVYNMLILHYQMYEFVGKYKRWKALK